MSDTEDLSGVLSVELQYVVLSHVYNIITLCKAFLALPRWRGSILYVMTRRHFYESNGVWSTEPLTSTPPYLSFPQGKTYSCNKYMGMDVVPFILTVGLEKLPRMYCGVSLATSLWAYLPCACGTNACMKHTCIKKSWPCGAYHTNRCARKRVRDRKDVWKVDCWGRLGVGYRCCMWGGRNPERERKDDECIRDSRKMRWRLYKRYRSLSRGNPLKLGKIRLLPVMK